MKSGHMIKLAVVNPLLVVYRYLWQAQLNQGFWAFLFGGTTNSAQSSSDNSTESKSLTVIITFDSNSTVSDFTYQSLKY